MKHFYLNNCISMHSAYITAYNSDIIKETTFYLYRQVDPKISEGPL